MPGELILPQKQVHHLSPAFFPETKGGLQGYTITKDHDNMVQ